MVAWGNLIYKYNKYLMTWDIVCKEMNVDFKAHHVRTVGCVYGIVADDALNQPAALHIWRMEYVSTAAAAPR